MARYLYRQLQRAGFSNMEQIDSRRKVNREEISVSVARSVLKASASIRYIF